MNEDGDENQPFVARLCLTESSRALSKEPASSRHYAQKAVYRPHLPCSGGSETEDLYIDLLLKSI